MKFKKILSTALAGGMILMTAACNNGGSSKTTNAADGTNASGASEASGKNTASEVEMPKVIKIMADGTIPTKANAQAEFEAAWEKLYPGIDLQIIQPDHDAYYDVLGQTFAGGDWPDVVLVGSTYYASYAGEGILWDMTDAFANSSMVKEGRVNAPDIIENFKIDGKLYGMPVNRGNGCITYVKKAWLDKAGLKAPTNYEEYLNMLKVFTEGDPDGNGVKGDTVAVASAGIVGKEAPYTNYLPEFYQDAYPSFMQGQDGKWTDGFMNPNMEQALARLREAYSKGYMDRESLTMGTKDARNKYYENKFGVFTYWAGKWNTNIKTNLLANKLDGELVALPPIKELGKYFERVAPSWGITTKSKNPEGVFKYFFETMVDGADGQTLWTYGAKGVHWDDKAGKVLDKEYKDGEFHMLESREIPGTQLTNAHIDPLLHIFDWKDKDPGAATHDQDAVNSQKIFNENSVQVKIVPPTTEFADKNGDLTTMKNELIARVVVEGANYADEMKKFVDNGGKTMSEEIVASLNK